MDKELLRIVIIAIGLIVIIGMLILEAFKNKKRHNGDATQYNKDTREEMEEPFSLYTDNDNIDIVPLGSALDADPLLDNIPFDKPAPNQRKVDFEPMPEAELKNIVPTEPEQESNLISIDQEQESSQDIESSFTIPEIIQIQVLALEYDGFNGLAIAKAFEQADLEYGSNKIYEHLDDNRGVNFSAASMVEPGLFPETVEEQKAYNCPGIVFFLQPNALDNPVLVFDKFIETINFIATELEGVKLDHNRDPLSQKTIQLIRKTLVEYY